MARASSLVRSTDGCTMIRGATVGRVLVPVRGRAFKGDFSMRARFMIFAGIACGLCGVSSDLIAAELTGDDRKMIEALLPKVLGKPADAEPLSSKLAGLHEGTWTYQIVSGKNQGESEVHVVSPLKRDPTTNWRYQAGSKHILFLRVADDGGISVISEQDLDQGVLIKYAPGEPVLIPDLKPGDTKEISIKVKVYDLSHPDDLEHTGEIKVTYSYLGDYQVTVPARKESYPAALIKSSYEGKIWLAHIKDTQYRFLTDGVGMVASVDKEDTSAVLIYQDHTKRGLVLQNGP
jgi:hypothetical protein